MAKVTDTTDKANNTKPQCDHEDKYPVATFLSGSDVWLWITCDSCGNDQVVLGNISGALD